MVARQGVNWHKEGVSTPAPAGSNAEREWQEGGGFGSSRCEAPMTRRAVEDAFEAFRATAGQPAAVQGEARRRYDDEVRRHERATAADIILGTRDRMRVERGTTARPVRRDAWGYAVDG